MFKNTTVLREAASNMLCPNCRRKHIRFGSLSIDEQSAHIRCRCGYKGQIRLDSDGVLWRTNRYGNWMIV
jgi:predicted RNA-binding Zn-ribbon protein involved in translation (DUF1610 family)